jgi:hypothetical protein
MHFDILKMYKDKEVNKIVKNILLYKQQQNTGFAITRPVFRSYEKVSTHPGYPCHYAYEKASTHPGHSGHRFSRLPRELMRDTVYERYRRAKYRSRDSETGILLLLILFACEINIKFNSTHRISHKFSRESRKAMTGMSRMC